MQRGYLPELDFIRNEVVTSNLSNLSNFLTDVLASTSPIHVFISSAFPLYLIPAASAKSLEPASESRRLLCAP